ncbi:MAG TPA: ATP-binding protein [Cytophagaceae bacterium]
MKPFLFRRHFFLIISIALFLTSLLIWSGFRLFNSNSNEKIVKQITKNVSREIKILKKEADAVKTIVGKQREISFEKLLQRPWKYPFFIFHNKSMVFWSDYRISPRYENLAGDFDLKFLILRNGNFIVLKNEVLREGRLYEIFSLIPLSFEYPIENNYISSGLNEELFHNHSVTINSYTSEGSFDVYTPRNEYLFSLELHDKSTADDANLIIVICSALAILFLLIYLFQKVQKLIKIGKQDLAILILLVSLIGIRALMLLLNYPYGFYENDLFNSRYFASSSISPSLGDLLLNTLALFAFAWVLFNNYYKTHIYFWLIHLTRWKKNILSVLIVILTFIGGYHVFHLFRVISFNSQWTLDITVSIDISFFKIVCLIIFILTCGVFFLFTHILVRTFLVLHKKLDKTFYLIFFSGCALYISLSLLLDIFYPLIIIVNAFLFILLVYLNLPRYLNKLKYASYFYYLFIAFICALIGAYSIYDLNFQKAVITKQKFASQLFIENDILGEFLLSEASQDIAEDIFIKNVLVTPFSSKEIIEQKVKKVYLSNYFEKYESHVWIYDAEGKVYEKGAEFPRFDSLLTMVNANGKATEYKNIFLVNELGKSGLKRYLNINEIKRNDSVIGYIVVDLRQKKIITNSVYPELLVDRKFNQPGDVKSNSYAIFAGDKLLYNFGSYNYDKFFIGDWFKEEALYDDGIVRYDFHHLAVKGGDGRTVVISSESFLFRDYFSNFSFLFLVLILCVLFLLLCFALLYRFKNLTITYATKIQIYLNIAFFLPLFIVSIATLSLIGKSYKEYLNRSFVEQAESIRANIAGYLNSYNDRDSREALENVILQISKYTESDINIFNQKGRLLFSSQPMIYNSGILSKRINPRAFSEIVENRSNVVMLTETVGKLTYNSVHIPIKSFDSGELTGILSIPFFESKNEMDKQIIEVLTTILNIFTTLFILFIILSYFASHLLIEPLKIITQKIKRTTLTGNKPLDWKSKDEIGLLVGEYNKMLVKLDQSREALAKSEKESAWREMAKQVAHEIKNPLTPMKLTIQHLQRNLKEEREDIKTQTERVLTTLLDQINNLDEIATSFSAFAKMPVPKNELYEITSILKSTINLHNNSHEVNVELEMPEEKLPVMGDGPLMSRIFTNLIINGIQSVPHNRTPKIKVSLTKQDKKVLIQIRDNGAGIPENIRNKVFIPNFSTKFSGSGIGLAVAKRGVEHAGGRIWFETQEGEGTSFYIELPVTN